MADIEGMKTRARGGDPLALQELENASGAEFAALVQELISTNPDVVRNAGYENLLNNRPVEENPALGNIAEMLKRAGASEAKSANPDNIHPGEAGKEIENRHKKEQEAPSRHSGGRPGHTSA